MPTMRRSRATTGEEDVAGGAAVANDDGTAPSHHKTGEHLRIASPQSVEDFRLHDHPPSSSAKLASPTWPSDLQRSAKGDRRQSSLSPLVEATLRRSSSHHGGNCRREQGDGLLSSAAARPWALKRRNRQPASSSAPSSSTNANAPWLPRVPSREVPIPGARSSPAFFDEENRARQTAHYENATWCMYERIVEGRRRQMVFTGQNAQFYFQEHDQQQRRKQQQRLDPRLEAILTASITSNSSLVDEKALFELEL